MKETIVCPACSREVSQIYYNPLVVHHWRGKNGHYYTKSICPNCNAVLKSDNGNHKLPSWSIQKQYIRAWRKLFPRLIDWDEYNRLRSTYFPWIGAKRSNKIEWW